MRRKRHVVDSMKVGVGVVDYLVKHSSSEVRFRCSDLALVFGVEDYLIYQIVRRLRSIGVPICSSPKGYFYSKDKEQIERTIESMKKRIASHETTVLNLTNSI